MKNHKDKDKLMQMFRKKQKSIKQPQFKNNHFRAI